MTRDTQQVGRLAMRVEGNYWVAYYALTDTMDEALDLEPDGQPAPQRERAGRA